MQDAENSTPEGENESGSIKPGHDSDYADSPTGAPEQSEKVYDFYHQHFGVALAAGSQEVRNAEASGRAAYAARTEVADKDSSPKSESWNALKSLIRYQSSTTTTDRQTDETTPGGSFDAQWFGKNSEQNQASSTQAEEPEAVRLKWTPIVDNVPDRPRQMEPGPIEEVEHAESSTHEATPTHAESLAHDATPTPRPSIPAPKKFIGTPSRMVRRPLPRPQTNTERSHEEALAATARDEFATVGDEAQQQLAPEEETTLKLTAPVEHGETTLKLTTPVEHGESTLKLTTPVEQGESTLKLTTPVEHDESTLKLTTPAEQNVGTESGIAEDSVLDEIDALLDPQDESAEEDVHAARATEDEEVSEEHAAEARSKFGAMNAFAKLQQRTKEKVETKEEQSITGDIPEEIQAEVQEGNWDTQPPSDESKSEGATVMNQWCSTSTGDSHPAISLADLDNIPTPSVMKDLPAPAKPFSLSTPKATGPSEVSAPSPDSVHQAARASWLKAASEYSSSVIKAVSEQMKMLSSKPKKVTPESPEFNTAELPDSTDES